MAFRLISSGSVTGGGFAIGFSPVVIEPNATRTLVKTDAASYIQCTNVAGCTITIPPQSDVDWLADTKIDGRGTLGPVMFVPGVGVTIDVPDDYKLEAVAKSVWSLKRESEDKWVLVGFVAEDI